MRNFIIVAFLSGDERWVYAKLIQTVNDFATNKKHPLYNMANEQIKDVDIIAISQQFFIRSFYVGGGGNHTLISL